MAIEYVKVQLNGIYRYSEKKWNDALLQKGSVRVGTLHDYRSAEHKPGIADAQEGLKWIHHHIENWNSADEVPGMPSLNARASAMLGLSVGPGSSVTVQNVQFVGPVNHPNCFIHCTSYKHDKDVMAEFEGADSCVQIYDFLGFYRVLTAAINKQTPVRWGGINIVHYQNRVEPCNGDDLGIPACWVKGVEFSRQYEVRAMWYPLSDTPIDWMALEVPELAGFCRRVKVR